MRVPLVIAAIPMLIVGVFGVFVSTDTALRFINQTPWLAPMKIRLATVVPLIVGNRSFCAVALSCVLILILKQLSDYIDKPLDR
jgi:hypothetical protein